MNIVFQAVFEKGVFRPLSSVPDIPEHATVFLNIVPADANATSGAEADVKLDDQGVTPELLQEVSNSIETALSNVRDLEIMRRAAERMDRAREEMKKRTGMVDVVV